MTPPALIIQSWLHRQRAALAFWSDQTKDKLHWLVKPYQRVGIWYTGLSKYWQHFTDAVIWGILIELVIHAAHDSGPVKNIQNWVFDKTLHVFSQREKIDEGAFKLPVILVVDDIAHQSTDWGKDRPVTAAQITNLAGQAFDRGATHVMVDFTLDDDETSDALKQDLKAFAEKYGQLTQKGEIRHLYVARSTKPNVCTPQRMDTDTLRRSIWESLPAIDIAGRPGLVIHSVLPHYIRDSDYVVRGWHLFGVTEHHDKNSGLIMLPSPQLAYYAVLDVTKNFKSGTSTLPEELSKFSWLMPVAQPDQSGTTQPTASHTSRGEYTFTEVQRLSGQLNDQKLVKLCKDHSSAFGCSVGKSRDHHNELWDSNIAKSPVKTSDFINDAMRPLPRAQGCRNEVINILRDKGVFNVESGRMYNRIVYSMSPWSEDSLPWAGGSGTAQWGYNLATPLELAKNGQTSDEWAGRLVAIGGAYASTGDWYQTPVGHAAGVFINVNAMQSMAKFGPISELPGYAKWGVNLAIIVLVAAVFAGLKPLTAALVCATILLGSLALFHDTLLTNGIWIEFGAPLLGINIHRFIDDFKARRRESQALRLSEDEHLKALGRIKLLQDRIEGSAWEQVVGGEELPSRLGSADDLKPASSDSIQPN